MQPRRVAGQVAVVGVVGRLVPELLVDQGAADPLRDVLGQGQPPQLDAGDGPGSMGRVEHDLGVGPAVGGRPAAGGGDPGHRAAQQQVAAVGVADPEPLQGADLAAPPDPVDVQLQAAEAGADSDGAQLDGELAVAGLQPKSRWPVSGPSSRKPGAVVVGAAAGAEGWSGSAARRRRRWPRRPGPGRRPRRRRPPGPAPAAAWPAGRPAPAAAARAGPGARPAAGARTPGRPPPPGPPGPRHSAGTMPACPRPWCLAHDPQVA